MSNDVLLHHAAHAAHTRLGHGSSFFFFLDIGDKTLGGQEQACHRRGILQSRTGDFGRIEDTGFEHINIFTGGDVESFIAAAFFDTLDNHTALITAIDSELTQGFFDRTGNNSGTGSFITGKSQTGNSFGSTHEGDTASGDDTFFDGGTGGVQSVIDTVFFLFHLNFSGGTDIDNGNTAGEFGETFLQFFTIVIAAGFFDFTTDLGNTTHDGIFGTVTFNDGPECPRQKGGRRRG